jgi:ribosomal-protein-alanine N-acetyltransferase
MEVEPMAEIVLRQMTPADVDGVLAVEHLSFRTPWSREAFEHEAEAEYALYLVATAGDQVVGYAGAHLVWGEAHVTNVAVHPDWRGRGLGEQLMRALEAGAVERGAHRATLEVRVSNTAARALYAKLGWVTAKGAVRKGYYTDTGEDAIVMWKDPLDGAV